MYQNKMIFNIDPFKWGITEIKALKLEIDVHCESNHNTQPLRDVLKISAIGSGVRAAKLKPPQKSLPKIARDIVYPPENILKKASIPVYYNQVKPKEVEEIVENVKDVSKEVALKFYEVSYTTSRANLLLTLEHVVDNFIEYVKNFNFQLLYGYSPTMVAAIHKYMANKAAVVFVNKLNKDKKND